MENKTESVVVYKENYNVLRPVVKADEMILAHREAADLIKGALEEGVDYGQIPGTGGKASLLKPGAERLVKAFGCVARYELVSSEVNHNFEYKWVDKYGTGPACGVYRYIYRCVIEKNGTIVGDGQGSCSTLESKYQKRPRDCENTVVKMAQKRALVAAVLNTFGLSNRFTQDLEDIEENKAAAATVTAQPTPGEVYQATPDQKVYFGRLAQHLGAPRDAEFLATMSNVCIGIAMSNIEAAIKEYLGDYNAKKNDK